ncbi:protein of unknown function [Microbulbifer thermotolerans]|uniref:Card1-like endonuclease domain-containing protein n=1 Tax=Microbulbifer thermotolerans TaxID=252514 RepID=UPI0008E58C74|nr:DUF1887 family CARF protein [Microbulbifer thermotolerans]SFD09795.1 protein of unknown function [Microbulbifer thermotolerans]
MAREVHFCLLSEQPSPNICPLLDSRLKPDEVVFVVSPQQRHRISWLKDILQPTGIAVSELAIEDAFDYAGIQEKLDSEIAQRREKGEKVLVNATGGTKPMSIAAYMAGYQQEVPVFYVHNDRVHWLEQGGRDEKLFDIEDRLKLKQFFLAHGYDLTEAKSPQVKPGHRELFLEWIGKGSYAESIRTLNWLAHRAAQHPELIAELNPAQQNDQKLQAMFDKLGQEGLLLPERSRVRFSSEEARALCNGLWLEDHCLLEAKEVRKKLPRLQDLGRGLTLVSRREGVKNELDLALLYDNRLHIIECKTRHYNAEEEDAAEALYKLATLVRQLGGIRARAMLVSHYLLNKADRRRAEVLDIQVVDGRNVRDFRSRLCQWLGVDTV